MNEEVELCNYFMPKWLGRGGGLMVRMTIRVQILLNATIGNDIALIGIGSSLSLTLINLCYFNKPDYST